MLRENDNNQVQAMGDAGEVAEQLDSWNHTRPFDTFAAAVRELAERCGATEIESFGETLTIEQWLDSERDLHAKARHDRFTDY